MQPFSFPPQLPSLAFTPRRYRPNGIGYWSGHIPFACDLIATLRPATFVELGTHMGESYFAFCQAIAENGVNCQAFAVDTWQGDVHTGAYGDEVFHEIDAYNTELYSGFSRLLRMRFEEAAEKFNDEDIDLLHIDGEHTYEAVARDFRRWWPKVKLGGVVIMHDSAERHQDFGVWKLLEELRRELPVAELVHSHGLGVIVKPPVPQKGNIATALVGANENRLCQMRQYYETCADHLQMEFIRKRQERGAEWEITSQLFWRGLDTVFTEANSVRLAHTVNTQCSEAFLKFPASPTPYGGFRLALTLLPAFLQLHRITVTTANGEHIWTINARNASELRKGGLHAIVADDQENLLIVDPPTGSHFDLILPNSVQNQMMEGGVFILEMSGLDPYTFASRLLSVQELHFAEYCSGPAEKQTKAGSAEKSFTSRILRHFTR